MGKRVSLHNILIVSILLISSLPILLISIFSLIYLPREIERDRANKILHVAHSLASEVDRSLLRSKSTLTQVARLKEQGLLSRDSMQEYIEVLLHSSLDLMRVLYIDEDGVMFQVASPIEEYRPIDPSFESIYEKALRTREESPYFSSMYISNESKEPTLTISLLLEEGVLVGFLQLQNLRERIEELLSVHKTESYVLLLHEEGKALINTHPYPSWEGFSLDAFSSLAEALEKGEGTYRKRLGPRGEETIIGVAMVKTLRIPLLISQPLEEGLPLVDSLKRVIGWSAILSLLLISIISVIMTRRILRPFVEFSRMTHETLVGNYPRHKPLFYQEMVQLSHTFYKIIDTLKSRERALEASEERFIMVLKGTRDGYWDWNIGQDRFYYSPRWKEIFGFAKEEDLVNGMKERQERIHPEDRQRVLDLFSQHLSGETSHYYCEFRVQGEDRESRWVLERGTAFFDEEGNPSRMSGSLSDINSLKEDEDRLRIALKEKEILLKEIHHRVKNNLQVISSLLRLAQEEGKDDVDPFLESQSRIASMALIHENLYGSSDVSFINFPHYVRRLVHEIQRTYRDSLSRVTIKRDIEPIDLDIDAAMNCGLIINELVTNSLKYAFPGDREGEIVISLKERGQEVELMVKDNGVGFVETQKKRGSLGLTLVEILSQEQLEGELIISTEEGTSFQVRFKGG